MVSDEVEILVTVLTEEGLRELDDFGNEIEKKATLWQRTKLKILNESREVMRSIMGLLHSTRAIFAAIGLSLGPLGDAMLEMITAIVNGAIAMQFAYAAGGPIGWAMMALSAAALAAALYAQVQAVNGIEAARRAGQQASSIMSNLSSIFSPWG